MGKPKQSIYPKLAIELIVTLLFMGVQILFFTLLKDYLINQPLLKSPNGLRFHVVCLLTVTGMVAGLTKDSATSKSVYFAHCTSEMILITHLLAEKPERLAGPLLADTYVTLLKGRNSWYGHKLATRDLTLDMGDSIKGKGMIQV